MSVSGKDLYALTRLRAADMQRTKYSDYQVLAAVNGAVRLLTDALVAVWSPVLVRTTVLTTAAGAALLPEDFISLVKAAGADGEVLSEENENPLPRAGQYRLEGQRLLSPEKTVLLSYRARPGEIAAVESDSVDLPADFLPGLTKMAADLLAGSGEAASTLAASEAVRSKQWSRNVPQLPPLWGGVGR